MIIITGPFQVYAFAAISLIAAVDANLANYIVIYNNTASNLGFYMPNDTIRGAKL